MYFNVLTWATKNLVKFGYKEIIVISSNKTELIDLYRAVELFHVLFIIDS
jgi:hypothetical protein